MRLGVRREETTLWITQKKIPTVHNELSGQTTYHTFFQWIIKIWLWKLFMCIFLFKKSRSFVFQYPKSHFVIVFCLPWLFGSSEALKQKLQFLSNFLLLCWCKKSRCEGNIYLLFTLLSLLVFVKISFGMTSSSHPFVDF